MKGRVILLDKVDGRDAAALMVDGELVDLVVDPLDLTRPRPGAIYRGVLDRPMKGQGGAFVSLPDGHKGFLRQIKGLTPGDPILVQVVSHAEGGKASPVTDRLLFKSRFAIVTPGAPGLNIARSIRDDEDRARLRFLAEDVMDGAADGFGAILRSAAGGAEEEAVADDLSRMRQLAEAVSGDLDGPPELLVDAPDADDLAWRDWSDPDPDEVIEVPGCFADHGVLDLIDDLRSPRVVSGAQAAWYIEPTRALVAVDVNTGGDTSLAAGLKANLDVAGDLPRQLRLRGLGGQIVIDFAPMPKKDRRILEDALRRAIRADGIETALVGWTPLGHYELQRKRERLPLLEALRT